MEKVEIFYPIVGEDGLIIIPQLSIFTQNDYAGSVFIQSDFPDFRRRFPPSLRKEEFK